MFSGEDFVRIKSALSREQLEGVIQDALETLGPVTFRGHTTFTIPGRRFRNTFAEVDIDGDLREGRRDGEWALSLRYSVRPSTACWVLVVIGALFALVGLLILLVPLQVKGTVERAVYRAVRDAKDEAESPPPGLPPRASPVPGT